MAHINRKYIDSHWLVFILRGVLALIFGWITLFNSGNDIATLISFTGIFLLSLSIIESLNSLHRARNQHGWLITVIITVLDAIFALALLFSSSSNLIWPLIVLSVYAILRGLFEIISAFRTTVDPTDRFIWLLCGICGCVMGFVIFNASSLAAADFVRFFGAYLLIVGISSLIYGAHNRAQEIEDHIARSESAKHKKSPKGSTKATRSTKKR